MNKPDMMIERACAFGGKRRVEAGVSCVLDPPDVARLLQEAAESDPFLLAAIMLAERWQARLAGTSAHPAARLARISQRGAVLRSRP